MRLSKRRGISFNSLMCWCIGKAASGIPEFFDLPVEDGMFRFDRIAVGPVVVNRKGGINYCNIPYSDDLQLFNSEMMVIGTSAMVQTELDCIVNQYAKGFNNPMVLWGRYRKGFFKTTLPVSFQFHHVQMDGGHGAMFLENIQSIIRQLKI